MHIVIRFLLARLVRQPLSRMPSLMRSSALAALFNGFTLTTLSLLHLASRIITILSLANLLVPANFFKGSNRWALLLGCLIACICTLFALAVHVTLLDYLPHVLLAIIPTMSIKYSAILLRALSPA